MNDNRPTEVILKIGVAISNTKRIPRKRYGKGFYTHVWTETNTSLLDFRRISYVTYIIYGFCSLYKVIKKILMTDLCTS